MVGSAAASEDRVAINIALPFNTKRFHSRLTLSNDRSISTNICLGQFPSKVFDAEGFTGHGQCSAQ